MNDVYDIVEWFYRNYFFQHIHHMFHLYSFSLNFFITPIFPTQNWYLNIKFILTCNSNYVYIFFAEVRTCLFLLTILVSHTGTHFLHTNHTHTHTLRRRETRPLAPDALATRRRRRNRSILLDRKTSTRVGRYLPLIVFSLARSTMTLPVTNSPGV